MSKKSRQIIAMGGGGFLMEPENPLLDDYILRSSGKKKPKICAIPTASGDSQNNIDRFYACYDKKNCVPAHLSLFRGDTDEIEKKILSQDILFIGGGNTRNLLVLWKEWKLDKIIQKAYRNGTVLAGVSAGSICWFEQGLTDSIPQQLNKWDCLGFLKGSNCPHFDGEAHRQPVYKKLIQQGKMLPGIATDDGCAVHYVNEKIHRVVSSRVYAKAYQFHKEKGKLIERVLEAEFLGK